MNDPNQAPARPSEWERLAETRTIIHFIFGDRCTEKQVQQILALIAEQVKPLQDFKDFTHRTLDTIGVPVELPESEHTKAGCRIGGRLEWIRDQLADLAEAERRVERMDQVCVDVLSDIAEIATKIVHR